MQNYCVIHHIAQYSKTFSLIYSTFDLTDLKNRLYNTSIYNGLIFLFRIFVTISINTYYKYTYSIYLKPSLQILLYRSTEKNSSWSFSNLS